MGEGGGGGGLFCSRLITIGDLPGDSRLVPDGVLEGGGVSRSPPEESRSSSASWGMGIWLTGIIASVLDRTNSLPLAL